MQRQLVCVVPVLGGVAGKAAMVPVQRVGWGGVLMTALVYGNGSRIPQELFVLHYDRCDLLIAADGGAYNVLEHDVVPDVIIGDLDSYTGKAPAGTELIHKPDQETNDLQKALSYALERGVRRAVIAGGTGDRLDHGLNNLSVLQEYTPRFESLIMIDIFGCYFVAAHDQRLDTYPGQTVSLFPLSGRVDGITTEGLRYPLHDETLENGVRNGCLNQALAPTIRIRHAGGALLVIIEH
ncbi:MAG: thiamine diphosphokinase [Spirochaetaceae bacterium]|nr:MAG: thiamine diphosphokinase [Spirochaetaceae bacterium]